MTKFFTAGLVSTLVAMNGGMAVAQTHPFEGLWGQLGTQCTSSGDTVPTEITGTEILYYESRCAIAEVAPIGEANTSWHVTLECSGEGATWLDEYVYVLHEGDIDLLSSVNMGSGYASLRERCG